jgi:hypothetical protein
MTNFTAIEKDALLKSIQYWIDRWDFECPTLFGLERSDLVEIVKGWPASLSINEKCTFIACLGSLRELLHGASAVSRSAVPAIIGIPYEEASALCGKIHSECQNVL